MASMLSSVVASLLNRFLGAYVELSGHNLQVGVISGETNLTNLTLKKDALDKFRLPVNVTKGHIGRLRIVIPWRNLRGQPIQVFIEDVYCLASPAAGDVYDPDEDKRRAQQAKMQKVDQSELLTAKPSAGMSAEEEKKNESFLASIANHGIDNIQISVKNVHIRYEDKLSVPGRPFSVGFTLAGFSAQSTDGEWKPTYVHGSEGGIHKLAKLDSMAVYFNTDTESLEKLPPAESNKKFLQAIATESHKPDHQFMLKPVSGEGRLIMHRQVPKDQPRIDATLSFDELGFIVDQDQYRDALSMVDLFHFHTRQHQYRKFRRPQKEIEENPARARFRFAQQAILAEIHERNRKWTWEYFRERRDDRNLYVYCFKCDARGEILPDDKKKLHELEEKLSYKDIRFYRSIARAQLRKEKAATRQSEQQSKLAGHRKQGWGSWLWGSTAQSANDDQPQDLLNDESRKELYEAIDWNEGDAITEAIDIPRECVKMKVKAQLSKGSFALRQDRQSGHADIISLVFDAFSANVLQRPDNLEAELALGGLRVFDGTRKDTLYSQIVRVKENKTALPEMSQITYEQALEQVNHESNPDNPFFYVKFEQNPLDERADTGLSVRMRYMEIIYHRGYIEQVVAFVKPPASQLESVSALVDVASSTLEGIRKETRAGLEYALQKHKTVDLQVDMNAPIIIIPEDISKERGMHIVLDAGHISVKSELASKDALHSIKKKEKSQYTENDFKELEALMYDKFFIGFEDAQLVMGDTLETCMKHLETGEEANSQSRSELHLLERINMAFKAETAIVANAPNLTRFKIDGQLPKLRVHFSDRKYKSLMRMIDVALPKFDQDDQVLDEKTAEAAKVAAKPGTTAVEDSRERYKVPQLHFDGEDDVTLDGHHSSEEDDDTAVEDDGDKEEDVFFETQDISEGTSNFHQKTFQFTFRVEELSAHIYKSSPDPTKGDRLLVSTVLRDFDFEFALRPYDMQVDLTLRTLQVNDMMAEDSAFPQLITSDTLDEENQNGRSKDLVKVKYSRVQPDSPEFMTVYEGINQSVEADLSTLSLVVTRASILLLFDWIMTTFTGGNDAEQQQAAREDTPEDAIQQAQDPDAPLEKLRVKVKLSQVLAILNDDGVRLATLSLSAADVSVFLRGQTMRVSGRLGNLSFTDDFNYGVSNPFNKMMSIEGDEVADFRYEKFDSQENHAYPGYDVSLYLRSGSFKFTFMEEPVHRLLKFFSKFARMKALYDAATLAAAQQASDFQERTDKLHYDVVVSTPIIIFPRNRQSKDIVAANLGEISVKNRFEKSEGDVDVTYISAGIRSIRLASEFEVEGSIEKLVLLDDVNLLFEVISYAGLDRSQESKEQKPDMKVDGNMSDVKMSLTQHQFCFLLGMAKTIPNAFAMTSEDDEDIEDSARNTPVRAATPENEKQASSDTPTDTVHMYPELSKIAVTEDGREIRLFSKIALSFKLDMVLLQLYDARALRSDGLDEHALARFSLNKTKLNYKMLSNGSMEAEFAIKSFVITDTRKSNESRFKEIIPATKQVSDQLTVSYTMSGGANSNAVAIVTVDTPSMIFSLDPLFALLEFATSPFKDAPVEEATPQIEDVTEDAEDQPVAESTSALSYRINVVQVDLKLLADPSRADSEAIVLSLKQVQLVQQETLVLAVEQLGMFLCKMDKPKEIIRIIDNFDVSLTMESKDTSGQKSTNIEIGVQPVIIRISYRDIMLAMQIFNRAVELQSQISEGKDDGHKKIEGPKDLAVAESKLSPTSPSSRARSASHRSRSVSRNKKPAEVIISREHLQATIDGFQLILIGDIHELPLIDLKAKKFMAAAQDWSGNLKASVTIAPTIDYYNLKNSHWEPLIDPWEFSIHASRIATPQCLSISMTTKKRLEFNVTANFIEFAATTAATFSREGASLLESSRGSKAPFLIKNRTGYPITFFAETGDRSTKAKPTLLEDMSDIPWRFDDYKTMRENMSTEHRNMLSVMLNDTAWDRVKHVAVHRQGEVVYSLKPKIEKVTHRLLCEVKLVDNIKVVTFRSTFNVENLTQLPIEVVIADANGKNASDPYRIPPGGEFAVPIESAYHHSIRMRPDPGFGYAWSSNTYYWRDLVKQPYRVIGCKSLGKEAPFNFQACAFYDKEEPLLKVYPKLTLKLRAPIEIENLLPFDIRYRIFDKKLERTWTSFLRKGGLSPLHVANLSHLTLFSLDMQDTTFKHSEFAIINTDNPDDLPMETEMQVEDHNGLKMSLRLRYERYPNSGGAFKVQVYSPFVLINRTGLDFAVQSKQSYSSAKRVAGQDIYGKENKRKEPIPFLFSYPTDDRKNRALLKFSNSTWSDAVSFEAIGTEYAIKILSQDKEQDLHLEIKITEGLGNYKPIKVVNFSPRFLIRNALGVPIRIRPSQMPSPTTLKPDERQPLLWFRKDIEPQMSISYPATSSWSEPINPQDIGVVHFRLKGENGKEQLIRADMVLEGAKVFVKLSYETEKWPFTIRNESDYPVSFQQIDVSRTKTPSTCPQYDVKARSQMPYAWDRPSSGDKALKMMVYDKETVINIMEIGALPPIPFKVKNQQRVLSVDVRAEGATQTLVLSNYVEAKSVYKPHHAASLARTQSMSSTREVDFQAKDQSAPITFKFQLAFEGIGVSLVNAKMHELCYMSFRGLEIKYDDSPTHQNVQLVCKWMQIDNQLFGGLYPIVLFPSAIPKEEEQLDIHPTLEVSVCLLKDQAHGVLYFKYATILLQELSVEIDEDFLFALMDFAKLEGVQWSEAPKSQLTDEPEVTPDPNFAHAAGDVYFEGLHLQPVQLNLSFMRTDVMNSNQQIFDSSHNFIIYILNALTMAIGNVNDAPIQLNALLIENVRISYPVLANRIMLHYSQDFTRQLFRVIGSADFLGNPIGLFNNVSSGVADLFYAPIDGVVNHGSGSGIARGAGSFVKKTVFGITDSMTKVTGSIGKGLSAATMDKEWQSRRRMKQHRNKPRHALYGITAGANSLVYSVASGFEGIARKPIEGAEEDGAVGFMKGFGKGLVGAFTKPVVGVFDLASNVTEGIRNTTTVFDQGTLDRVRLPRFIASDGILKPYSQREAVGQNWLKNLESGRYMKEIYVAHLEITVDNDDVVVLLTETSVILVKTAKLKVAWNVPLSDLQTISMETAGIALILRKGISGPFLAISDQNSKLWFFGEIEKVVNMYNLHRNVSE